MLKSSPCRLAVLAGGLVLATMAQAQGGVAAQQGATVGSNAQAGSGGRSSRRAEVEYTDGLLHILADNSSLNQILREVGRLTGMKITGGVQDDRVFGTYGPAPASQVLAKLLDGASSNLLIVENDSAGPAELILTPRRGGVTPPNPNGAMAEDQERQNQFQQQQLIQQQQQGFFLNGQPGNGGAPIGGLPPGSNAVQPVAPASGAANPGAFPGFGQTQPDAAAQPAAQVTSGDGNEPQSSNGVSTPQQIYEQLQRLRQQQQQTTPVPSPQ